MLSGGLAGTSFTLMFPLSNLPSSDPTCSWAVKPHLSTLYSGLSPVPPIAIVQNQIPFHCSDIQLWVFSDVQPPGFSLWAARGWAASLTPAPQAQGGRFTEWWWVLCSQSGLLWQEVHGGQKD